MFPETRTNCLGSLKRYGFLGLLVDYLCPYMSGRAPQNEWFCLGTLKSLKINLCGPWVSWKIYGFPGFLLFPEKCIGCQDSQSSLKKIMSSPGFQGPSGILKNILGSLVSMKNIWVARVSPEISEKCMGFPGTSDSMENVWVSWVSCVS